MFERLICYPDLRVSELLFFNCKIRSKNFGCTQDGKIHIEDFEGSKYLKREVLNSILGTFLYHLVFK